MLEYSKGTPEETGIYAVRTPVLPVITVRSEQLCEDAFMYWDGRHWSHVGSSLNFRGEVIGFIGPLRRMHKEFR